jgi:enoyl-CoA hydratase
MARNHIINAVEDRIAVVTISHPPVNSLNEDVIKELSDIFKELEGDKNVGAVVITGGGEKAFVAGADIRMFNDLLGKREKIFIGAKAMQECFTKIENFDKLVIAAINGLALGGGCELAVACDIRIAAENAVLGVPEVKLGIIPGAGGTQRLTRLLGKGKAKMMVLGGGFFSARDAFDMGLVEKVVPHGQAVNETKQLAREFLSGGPLAIRNGKKAINVGCNMMLEDGLHLEAELLADLFMTEDAKEGVQAFFEKRPPKFQGK